MRDIRRTNERGELSDKGWTATQIGLAIEAERGIRMNLGDQGDRKIPGLKQGPALRQAGLCRMVEPGVVVEGPVGRVSRQDTQLMVEQDHRQG
ncbi:conserved hypothetical protein [Nitrospira defluvii]|uniref:Uncharacterized protein n=1 Tax=Nitrospira defluvii TaxID=330214 RepID=A0ABM8SC78_9BACT|nr:conserved hypothetical protein [Nitrospira defluvii]